MTTYTYDDLHRLTGRSYSRGGSSVSYPTAQGADSFTYDRVGRMLTSSHVQGSDTFAMTMTYDAAGRTTNLDQDGFDIDHGYAVGSSPHYVQTTYPNGRVVKQSLGDILVFRIEIPYRRSTARPTARDRSYEVSQLARG